MSGTLTRDFVETVRSAVDIARVVSEYVPLKPAGARLKGLCPFHQEKTPSFHVDPERKLFFCFGCQTGGDLFKFVMLYEQVEFPEAVRILAERNGIPIPKAGSDGSRETDLKTRILESNKAAREYYRGMLSAPAGSGARKYLESRDLSAETLETLSVGYAPDGWDHLRNHLTGKQFAPSELVQAGLASPRKDGSGEYDRFRNRIIFPIQDLYGKTIAFGGRAIPPVEEREPKYLNSPETPAYVKGEHLYGLNLAREAIRREGYAIVVEGYMDLAALIQAGFLQGVASLGTAFTQAQARLLGRYTRRVVVSYDGDAAGSKAAVRSLDLLLEQGFEVRLVDLPEGMDPDDVIRRNGPDAYSALVRQAPEYIEWMVNRESRGRTMGTAREKIEAVNSVLPHIARMNNPIERVSWTGRLADALGIDDDLVLQELRAALKEARPDIRQRVHKEVAPEMRQVERRLLALMLASHDIRMKMLESDHEVELEGSKISGIVEVILSLEESGQPVDYPAVLEALERLARLDDQRILTQLAFDDEPTGGMEEADACLKTMRRERLVRERKDVQDAIRKTQDRSTLDALLLQQMQLARQIDTLT
ncbi:MAG: DNA primase [Acidobacteria bacterium]|uniref:DNA primase n=1 Tax=Candidatus Polarisedimenticola svalbardensis TaxID=2886004 RepID=A0A8J6XUW0_9BACT|nr:DNA primase [Candidatus Polarisedimenticola svalbardensis]